MPNMDEVVRREEAKIMLESLRVNEWVADRASISIQGITFIYSYAAHHRDVENIVSLMKSYGSLMERERLLIEEREQLKVDKLEIARHLGEEIAGLEFEIAEQDKEIQRLKEGWEVMAVIPMSLHPSEVRIFAKKMLKGGTPYKFNH